MTTDARLAVYLVLTSCAAAPADEGDSSSSDGGEVSSASTSGATTTSSDPSTSATTQPSDESTSNDSTDDDTTGSGETGPMPMLGECDALAGEGVFEDITPAEVAAGFGVVQDGGGAFAFAVDPINQGTVYLGTVRQKVWKSTDCGASWVHIATGTNGEAVDSGMNWTFAVDPIEPEVVYTNAGYGAMGNGLFKSQNGGVDWDVVWPPAEQPELSAAFTYNFANVIAIDPADHQHVLLTFHESCLPPHTSTCIAESFDAGASWVLHDGEPEWNGNEGQVIFFLDGPGIWLWGSQTNGFWRSGDSGASWEAIEGMTTSHLQGSQLLHSPAGTWLVAGADAIWRSADGTADSWSPIADTGPILGGLISDGTSLYASNCYFGGFCEQARYLKSTDDGLSWQDMDVPPLAMGGSFGYDPGHGVLYSSNGASGFWRVVVNPQ
ncbi:MAG TPA: hypothetical protein VG755_45045 [Nannocystaceae bacterium]|nr:hypothetical protein [Nannocystaceae bacterium]